MEGATAYENGLLVLADLWERTGDDVSHLPSGLRGQIDIVMSPDSLKAQRYALINQLLLKIVTHIQDSRTLEGFGEDNFTARTFAKMTVAKFNPVQHRIGNSKDPYVSNPLRQRSLTDKLINRRGGKAWEALLEVLDTVDDHPEIAEPTLIHALAKVRSFKEEDPVPKVKPTAPQVTTDPTALHKISGIEQNLLLDILEVLESDQPQVILAGPPGTSKTHTAQALASYLTEGDLSRVTTVQLHATYGYEDFVEGLRPVASSSGALTFQVKPGVLRRVAESSGAEGERKVLILDEMNRSNLPRVLGELLFAVERRGEPVDLLYTRAFRLPPEICFIGTMNTADRSIRSLDAAVRRRFMIFELAPSAEALNLFYADRDNEVPELVEGFEKINDKLTQLLDRHHTIGHTYLMDERGMTTGRLNQVWLRQLRPLIEEYLFDQPEALDEFTIEAFWPSAVS